MYSTYHLPPRKSTQGIFFWSAHVHTHMHFHIHVHPHKHTYTYKFIRFVKRGEKEKEKKERDPVSRVVCRLTLSELGGARSSTDESGAHNGLLSP